MQDIFHRRTAHILLSTLALAAWAAVASLAPLAAAEAGPEISFRALTGESGMQVEAGFTGQPDAEGVLRRYPVRLPPFEVVTYWAAYQKYDPAGPQVDNWPEGANRVQPLAIHGFESLKRGGLFLLAKLNEGGYLALLPVAGARTLTWFSGEGGRLMLNLGTLGAGAVRGDLPLLAWARSNDPYDAARNAWITAINHPLIGQSARLRSQKHYPQIFRYLGWCSWEEYRSKIDEQILLGAVDAIEKSGVPVRWLLVDDGHLDNRNRQLLSFQPNAKFPHGWRSLLARRRPDKIRWMGVWLNFNGYWNGISPQNKLGALNEHLAPAAGGQRTRKMAMLEPKLGFTHSLAFYNAMIGAARAAGFDFVKVDNQAGNLRLYRGGEQPVQAAVENARALEEATAFHMDGLINCMAHGTVNTFNTRLSAVTRCSEDYRLGDLARARRHLHNSYANMIWLGHTVWGDHDMFHSDDPVAGRVMAVSKALSGGPVYLSDNPKDFRPEYIRPLCFRDGRLLRPLAPGAPLAESLFIDPFQGGKPFRVIAPLPGRAAAVVVYNLTEPEAPLTGSVKPDDYAQANALMQPRRRPWKLPAEGLVLYDWRQKRAVRLKTSYSFSMPKFGDRLLLLCPVQKGWAVIGRPDKYLAPAAVKLLRVTAQELLLEMREAGPLTVWQENAGASVTSPDCEFHRVDEHLWSADVPGARAALVRVRTGG